jgi:hypothetical protein
MGAVTGFVPSTGKQTFDASGEATHLGQFTVKDVWEVLRFTWADPTTGAHGGAVLDGEIVFRAADGRTTLTARITGGEFSHVPGSPVDLLLEIEFTEGTGRMAGVSGTAGMHALAEGAAPPSGFTFTSEGTLTFSEWPLK